jgi:hypothetical protein
MADEFDVNEVDYMTNGRGTLTDLKQIFGKGHAIFPEFLNIEKSACVESSVPPKEPVVNFPYVYASIDKPSGLHALWLVVKDELGVVKPIAGPEPWPEGWTKLYAEAYDAALNK